MKPPYYMEITDRYMQVEEGGILLEMLIDLYQLNFEQIKNLSDKEKLSFEIAMEQAISELLKLKLKNFVLPDYMAAVKEVNNARP